MGLRKEYLNYTAPIKFCFVYVKGEFGGRKHLYNFGIPHPRAFLIIGPQFQCLQAVNLEPLLIAPSRLASCKFFSDVFSSAAFTLNRHKAGKYLRKTFQMHY